MVGRHRENGLRNLFGFWLFSPQFSLCEVHQTNWMDWSIFRNSFQHRLQLLQSPEFISL